MANRTSSGAKSGPGSEPELNEYTDTSSALSSDEVEAPEEIAEDDVPQEVTQSYGTGVKDQPGWATGGRTLYNRRQNYNETSPELSGGDVDAAWTMHMEGEEMVGGTVATPDQDIVDDLGAAMGTEMRDREDYYGNDKFAQRDEHRWDLDPASAEDYQNRHQEE